MIKQPIVIWWAKRDLRLADNAALSFACSMELPVLPVFCLEPSVSKSSDYSHMHLQAQMQALTVLRLRLRKLGADLLFLEEEVLDSFTYLNKAFEVKAIVSHQETGNDITFGRDLAVKKWAALNNVIFKEIPQSAVSRGKFSRDNFDKVWKDRIVSEPVLAAPNNLNFTNKLRRICNETEILKTNLNRSLQEVNEDRAGSILSDFLERRSCNYSKSISSPLLAAINGSRLSAQLAWGAISLKTVYQSAQLKISELKSSDSTFYHARNISSFISRLHWRDHFIQRLESQPDMEFQAVHPLYRDFLWSNEQRFFESWINGQTGYPLVDAVMRCLSETGFVNFRMRAMVVSFACHVLHLDWRMIHPHLAKVFLDYEPGIHISQLQMQAGVVGLNTIRVYNPNKQLADHDAECVFVKKWIPELRRYSIADILNAEICAGYVPKIVDWKERSESIKKLLYIIKNSDPAKELTAKIYVKHGSRKKRRKQNVQKIVANKQLSIF